jgi:hypothetical protein
MSNREIVFTSLAETSPFLQETGYFAYRDPKFIDDELFLDDIVTHGRTEEALPLEKKYLTRLERTTHASEGLARTAYKAIAVSQYARQIDVAPRLHKDTTYKNLGLLLDRSIAEQDRQRDYQTTEEYYRYIGICGLLAEMAIFTALSYDSRLKHPLTGRPRSAPAHHILPSSIEEDRGGRVSPEEQLTAYYTGYDLKVFTPDESTPVIPLQTKTSLMHNNKHYAPGITMVPLDEIAATTSVKNESVLPGMLRDEALGRRTRASRLQLTATNRILDSMIQFEQ